MSRLDFIRAKIRNRRANRGNRFAVSAAVVVGLVVLCFGTNAFSTSSPHGRAGGRQLMGEGFSLLSAIDGKECSRNLPGPLALIFWIFGVLYMFLAIAIVCDDFFVASLEVITERLDLSDDVAGATFMAAGSSAPELFTSVTGVFFVENVKTDNPGAGTIVGSAVFNIAVIIGGSVIYAKNTLELDWYPLARDGIYYTWAVICVVVAFIGITPGQVDWWEGMMFLIFYALYIVIMKFNPQLDAYFHGPRPEKLEDGQEMDESLSANRSVSPKVTPPATESAQHDPHPEGHAHEEGHEVHTRPRSGSALTKTYDARPHVIHHPHEHHLVVDGELPPAPATDSAANEINVPVPATETPAADDDDEPKGPLGKFIEILAKPIVFVLSHTIPDCKEKPQWFMVSFAVSVFWIAFISYFMVEFALKMGLCLDLSANVMGLTVLAAGTSVPDALSSFIVAKQGKGNMAVSNAIGSNIFDIFLGLGLPWFMYGAMIEREPLPLNTHGIIYDIIMLFMVLVAFILIVKLTGWKLKVWQGYLMCSLYSIYVVMALLIDKGTIPTIYHQD